MTVEMIVVANMVADLGVDKVADIEVDKVADIDTTWKSNLVREMGVNYSFWFALFFALLNDQLRK